MKNAMIFILSLLLGHAHAADLSSLYNAKRNEAVFNERELKKLKDLKILIVPGILAESFDSKSGNQIKVGFIFEDGFREQKALMKKYHLNYEYISVDTESSVETNSNEIIKAIEESREPVLIYSHSKGGLDTLEAFRKRPDLLSKVHGWVTVQSPFWGAPTADLIYNNGLLRDQGKSILEWMGGDIGGMIGLTVTERKTFMDNGEIQSLIKKIKREVKFLNFGSYKSDVFGIDTPLELFRNLDLPKSGPNDGVVPLTSAVMAYHGYNVDYVIEPEVDHLMTITKYIPDHFDFLQKYRLRYNQQTHTMALLKVILE